MPKRRHKPEEVFAKLCRVDAMVSQSQSVADAVRAIGVTEVTYHRLAVRVRRAQVGSGHAPEGGLWMGFARILTIGYTVLASSGMSKVPLRTEDSSEYGRVGGYPAPLNVVLLTISGLALLGSGALLAFQSGTFVSFGDAMLAAVAWCF